MCGVYAAASLPFSTGCKKVVQHWLTVSCKLILLLSLKSLEKKLRLDIGVAVRSINFALRVERFVRQYIHRGPRYIAILFSTQCGSERIIWNRKIFGEDMDTSLVARFYGPSYGVEFRFLVACWLYYSNFEHTDIQFDKSVAPNVEVLSDGTCNWYSPGRFSTPCPIDISLFPFDNQTCSLVFQSWLYSGLKLNLSAAFDIVETQVSNGEWSLIGRNTKFIFEDQHLTKHSS